MIIKINELTGSALDWAVAKCEGGVNFLFDGITWGFTLNGKTKVLACKPWAESMRFTPSTDWAQGGPIIERHCINLFRLDPKTEGDDRFWLAHIDGIYCRYGVSALTASMRCYVASKLGDEVDVPKELTK